MNESANFYQGQVPNLSLHSLSTEPLKGGRKNHKSQMGWTGGVNDVPHQRC